MKNLILIILLSSCSASYHARKALKKNPKSFKSDTTVVIDTVIQKGATTNIFLHDTLYLYKDTVIYQDRIKFQIVKDSLSGKPRIIIDCPEDTTINTTKTITDTLIVKPKKESIFKRIYSKIKSSLLLSVFLVLSLIFIIFFMK